MSEGYKIGKSKSEREFSSTQVNLTGVAANKVLALARKIKDSDLAEDGREDEPHITVKFGLHDGRPSKELRDAVVGNGHVQAKLGKTSLFESDRHDVVKLEVSSHDLHRLNKKVAASSEHTDTHPNYVPHVTLAYVKKGAGKKYAGDDSLSGEPLTFDHVVFSAKDRTTHKLPLSRHGKYSIRS